MQINVNLDTPRASAQNTKALLSDQGFTYNEPGKTYNEPGMTYGGIYNYSQDFVPTISQAESVIISAKAIAQSMPSLLVLAKAPIPSISGREDIYTAGVVGEAGVSMGYGFLMYVTFPVRTFLVN